MPRMARLETPGAIEHVIARGIDGANLFFSDEDRKKFLAHLDVLLRRLGYRCITWCLMDNHYHLLLRINENPLGKFMRPLNGAYARWFNKKYGRRGYLFQDRFKSILCQDQEYALQLIRYINLNPLRAGKVRSLSMLVSWPWCGHAMLLGKPVSREFRFQDRKEALSRFGRTEKEAIAGYLAYLAQGIHAGTMETAGALSGSEEFELAGAFKGWPAVIGDPEFARNAMARHRQICLMRKHRQADYSRVLQTIEAEVCARYKIPAESFLARGRMNARSAARSEFAYRAHCEELLPLGVVAGFLGITISPVARMVQRGKQCVRRKP